MNRLEMYDKVINSGVGRGYRDIMNDPVNRKIIKRASDCIIGLVALESIPAFMRIIDRVARFYLSGGR